MLGISIDKIIECRRRKNAERSLDSEDEVYRGGREYNRQKHLASELAPIVRQIGMTIRIEPQFLHMKNQRRGELWVKVFRTTCIGLPDRSRVVVMVRLPSHDDNEGIFVNDSYLDRDKASEEIERLLCE